MTKPGVVEAAERIHSAQRELAECRRAIMSAETELKIVVHFITRDDETVTARMVLKDEDGFFRAVLAVGDPEADPYKSVDSAIRKFEAIVTQCGNRSPE